MSDRATDKKLSTRQIRALTAYYDKGDIDAACKEAGCYRSTFYRWMADDELFQAACKDAESRALAMLSGQLVALASKAGQALFDVFDSATATPAQRLRAAEIVLSNLLRIRELVTLEERIARLEQTSGFDHGSPWQKVGQEIGEAESPPPERNGR